MTCTRCHTPILPGQEERCWWCLGTLCYVCWDAWGHCGHAEAEAVNARLAAGQRPTREALTAGWTEEERHE